jgi:probable HAF family extracellular repeat protein
MHRKTCLASLALVLLSAFSPASQAARYTIKILDGGPGKLVEQHGISPNGRTTGRWCCDGNDHSQPFVARNGKLRRLDVAPDETAYGIAINNAGTIVGESYSDSKGQSFFYEDATGRHQIGADGLFETTDINKIGQVVGTKIDRAGFDHGAFIYFIPDGSFIPVEGLGATYIHPTAIDNEGTVAGEYEQTPGRRCFIHKNGEMSDLGDLGGDTCMALDMNDQGAIVGYAIVPGGASHAYVWEKGKMKDLLPDSFKSWATGINNKRQIVGQIKPDQGQSEDGFLYEKDKLTLLKDLLPPADAKRWKDMVPRGISDKGEIVGDGVYDSNRRAFIMRPTH